MAEPTDFPEANMTWQAPKGADNVQDVKALRVYDPDLRTPVNITKWVLTPEELVEIAQTGVVYLSILGDSMPPVLILGNEPMAVTVARGTKA